MCKRPKIINVKLIDLSLLSRATLSPSSPSCQQDSRKKVLVCDKRRNKAINRVLCHGLWININVFWSFSFQKGMLKGSLSLAKSYFKQN